MATIKKYNGSTWENAVVRKYGTASEIITPPTTIYANGQPISTYSIKGNTVQNGTPTPSNPVAVNGTGDRTENLYNIATVVENTFIKANTTGSPLGSEISNSDWSCSDYIEVSPNTEYTVQYPVYVYAAAAGLVFFTSKSVSSAIEGVTTATQGSKTYTFTTPNNCNYVRFSWGNSKGNETMFVTGGTAKTYEPYGFKIPILNLSSTTNIYLSEPLMKISDSVDSISNTEEIRAIQKLVITGDETNWEQDGSSGNNNRYRLRLTNLKNTGTYITDFYNSHYKIESGYAANTSVIWRGSSSAYVYISTPSSDYPTISDYKTYLQQQYTNGTPVTIWYQMANPTTTQITVPSIPTTDGTNTITVDTTVQPSEFSATWTGWHDASVKEAKHGNNLFDYTTMSVSDENSYLNSDGTIGASNDWNITEYIPCDGTSFTVGDIGGNAPAICLYNANKEYITGKSYNTGGIYTKQAVNITSQTTAKFIRFSYYKGSLNPDDISTIMLNSGSSLLPYEPYSIHWE